jgi:hypothetical protein
VGDAHVVGYAELADADLVMDRVYKGGSFGNARDDPLARLLPGVGNQGGFRALGRHSQDAVRLVVLYTSGAEPDWPDALDPYTGAFTYFGDNRSPGRTLHDTPRKGNLLLDAVFTRSTRAGTAASGSPRSCCSTSPGRAAMCGSAGCSRPARTGSAAKRTWWPSGARPGDTGSRTTGPGSLS